MENTQFDSQRSMTLIAEMINNTRNRMERNAGRPFLIWGYLTVAVTLAVWFALEQTQDYRWNYLWLSIPVLGWGLMYLTRLRETGEGKAYTFVDRVINQVWLVIGVAAFFVGVLAVFAFVRTPVIFTMILLMSIGTTITNLIIRFTPGIVCGGICVVLAPLMLFVASPEGNFIGFATAFILMMIIPGHILNFRSNHPKKS